MSALLAGGRPGGRGSCPILTGGAGRARASTASSSPKNVNFSAYVMRPAGSVSRGSIESAHAMMTLDPV